MPLPLLASALAAASVVAPPPAGARVDYQLGGAYPPAPEVQVVTRDRTERPAPGHYGICYVNAFQTQPGARGWWLRRHPRLVLRDRAGRPASDAGWPGELILDTRTPARRAALATIVGRQVDGCARRGFRAVEPDNLDTHARFPALTQRGALAYARLLARRAHADGLAIAQKNDTSVTPAQARRVGFDFAVAEECEAFRECGAYTRSYGTHVIEVEYTDTPHAAAVFARACRARGATTSVLLRDRDVVPRGHAGYVSRWC